jgi:hypothetical protein
MPRRSETESLALRLWRQLYQTYTLLKRSEDEAAGSFGLTTEQYAVLVTLDYFGGGYEGGRYCRLVGTHHQQHEYDS